MASFLTLRRKRSASPASRCSTSSERQGKVRKRFQTIRHPPGRTSASSAGWSIRRPSSTRRCSPELVRSVCPRHEAHLLRRNRSTSSRGTTPSLLLQRDARTTRHGSGCHQPVVVPDTHDVRPRPKAEVSPRIPSLPSAGKSRRKQMNRSARSSWTTSYHRSVHSAWKYRTGSVHSMRGPDGTGIRNLTGRSSSGSSTATGHATGNALDARRKAHNDGRWVREALAAKQRTKERVA